MKTEEFTTVILRAESGKFLTQTADVPINERAVAETVAVGRNDSPDNWKEIEADEAAEWKARIREHTQAQMAESLAAMMIVDPAEEVTEPE